jgi:hypothetical protein
MYELLAAVDVHGRFYGGSWSIAVPFLASRPSNRRSVPCERKRWPIRKTDSKKGDTTRRRISGVREALVTPGRRMDDLCRDANTSERNLSLFSTAEIEWRRVSGMITYWMIDAKSPGDYLDEDRHGFHACVLASEIVVPWSGKASEKGVFHEMTVDFLFLVQSTP